MGRYIAGRSAGKVKIGAETKISSDKINLNEHDESIYDELMGFISMHGLRIQNDDIKIIFKAIAFVIGGRV